MNQVKFYKYATFGLLLLNVSMIAFFFVTKPNPRNHPLPPRIAQEKAVELLQLDEQQKQHFFQLVEQHQQQMQTSDEKQRSLLENYFQGLVNTSLFMQSADQVIAFSELEKQKVELTYQHFQEVKEILHPEQMEHFESFMQFVLRRLLPAERNGKKGE